MPAFHVEKSIEIDAPAASVFEHVRNFQKWPTWSPWLITDPDCSVEFAEDGDSYSWDGEICGAGEMAVLQDTQHSSIDFKLTFLKPWKSEADVFMRLTEEGGKTTLTWSMDSSLPFFMFWMKSMMVGFIGMDYERGLLMLKELVETGAVSAKLDFVGEQSFQGLSWVGIRNTCAIPEIGPKMEADFGRLKTWIQDTGTVPSRNLMSIYHKWNMGKQAAEYTALVPVETVPDSLPDGFTSGTIPDCKTWDIRHTGYYHYLGNAWSAGVMRGRNKVFRQSKALHPFEEYETAPGDGPESEARTVVHFPVKK